MSRVRRALSMAIDRQSLIDNVTQGRPGTGAVVRRPGLAGAPTMQDHPDLGIKFDAAKAKAELDAYLKEKGLTADQLDITLMFNTSSGHQKIAEAIQQMWKDNLGIDVKVVNQEWKVFLKTTKDPKNTPQIFRLGWCLDYPDANNFDQEVFGIGRFEQPEGGSAASTGRTPSTRSWSRMRPRSWIPRSASSCTRRLRTSWSTRMRRLLPIYWYTV